MNSFRPALCAAFLAALVAGGAANGAPATQAIPAAIQTPAGTVAYLEVLADGVQIYECALRPDSTYQWAFKAPRAALSDTSGKAFGKHYAGPSWEAADGSLAVGEVKAQVPSPTPGAIAWLLLAAKSSPTSGTLSDVKFVHRVATVGGVAPAQGCGESTLRQQIEVPYTATYVFYR